MVETLTVLVATASVIGAAFNSCRRYYVHVVVGLATLLSHDTLPFLLSVPFFGRARRQL